MNNIDNGLNVWQMTSNHNRMIDPQADTLPPRDEPVEIAFFRQLGISYHLAQGRQRAHRFLAQSPVEELGLVLSRFSNHQRRHRGLDSYSLRS